MGRRVALALGVFLLVLAAAWLTASFVMGTMMDVVLGEMMGGRMWAGLLAYPIALAVVGIVLVALGLWRRPTAP
ncbi:MAG: hypothetical protein M3N16_08680 [Actinomycetota bacterium]|nr:hypothetical protein [Actinomycetota bacterium]